MNVWIGMEPLKMKDTIFACSSHRLIRSARSCKSKRAGALEAHRPLMSEDDRYSSVTRLASIPDKNEPSMNGAMDSTVGGSPSIEPRSMIHAPSSTISSNIS